jgi:hypothetical protein
MSKSGEMLAVKVAGVLMAAVDETILRFECAAAGLDNTGAVEMLVDRYQTWAIKTLSKTDQSRCDICHGISSYTLETERCPFCGDGEVTVDVETPPPVAARQGPNPAKLGQGLKVVPDRIQALKAAMPTIPDAPPPAKTQAVKLEKVVKPAKAKPANDEKQAKVKKAKKAEKPAKVVEKKPIKALAKVVSADIEVCGGTEADLDESLAKIKTYDHASKSNWWHLGRELAEVKAKNLWKARVDAQGLPIYKSFDVFTHTECKIPASFAHQLIDVSARFNLDQMTHIGPVKLAIALKAPEAEIERIVARLETGATASEIRQDVKELKAQHGLTGSRRNLGRGSCNFPVRTGPTGKAKTVSADALLSTTVVVPLFKREDETLRAHCIEDRPVGKSILMSGVQEVYTVQLDPLSGALVLQIERVAV